MPLYTITTQDGVLNGEAKATFAAELTAFHSEYAGVPKNWVHIVFQDYAAGNGFTAGEVAATATLTLLIRTGRSAEYKARVTETPLEPAAGRDRRSRRPDRPWHSGGAAEPGHGDGTDHAGC